MHSKYFVILVTAGIRITVTWEVYALYTGLAVAFYFRGIMAWDLLSRHLKADGRWDDAPYPTLALVPVGAHR